MSKKTELKGVIKESHTTTGVGDSFYVTIQLFGEGNYGVNHIKKGDEVVVLHKRKNL